MCFRRPKYVETAKNATAGSIDVSSLTTGDILLFSDNWSDSSVKRMVRNANDKLWVSGGIVINAPSVFQDVMLLQHDLRKNDNQLQNHLDFTSEETGVKLVGLSARLKFPDYQTCMLRKINPNIKSMFQREPKKHVTVTAAFTSGIPDTNYSNSGHMIFNALRNAGLLEDMKIPLDFNLAQCANNSINELGVGPNLYSKGELYFREFDQS
jgi:hypothetical protein